MKVHVKLQGTLPNHYQGTYPQSGLLIDLDAPVTIGQLVDHLGLPRKRVSLVSVNGLLGKSDDLIPDGAKIKLLQQLSGG